MDTSGVGSSGRTTTTGRRGIVDRLGPLRAIPVIMFGALTLLSAILGVVLTVVRGLPPVTLLLFVLAFALMTIGSLRGPRDQPAVGLARQKELRRRLRRHDVRAEDAGDLAAYRDLDQGVVRSSPWFLLALVPMAISFHLQAEERQAELLEVRALLMRGLLVLVVAAGVLSAGMLLWRWRWSQRTSAALAELGAPTSAR